MSQIVSQTGVTQIVNVQIESAIQKLFFQITGVATLAQMQAVTVEVLKVGQEGGTDQLVFAGNLEDYLEMNAQQENGTFTVAANTMIGNLMICRDNSLIANQGDNLTLNLKNLITTMIVNVYGLETKAVGRSYTKFSPVNVSGLSPRNVNVGFQDYLYIPNDGTIEVVELYYKGRAVRYEQAELQAINRDLRSVISPNYGGAVFAGFVNWLGINLLDVMQVQLTPSQTNVNTTVYFADAQVVVTLENGSSMKLNGNSAVADGGKRSFAKPVNPGGVELTTKQGNKLKGYA